MTHSVNILHLVISQQAIDDGHARQTAHERLSSGRLENQARVGHVESNKRLEQHTYVFSWIGHVSDGVKCVLGCCRWRNRTSVCRVSQKFPVSFWKLAFEHTLTKHTRCVQCLVSIDQKTVRGMNRLGFAHRHVHFFGALFEVPVAQVHVLWNRKHKRKADIVRFFTWRG